MYDTTFALLNTRTQVRWEAKRREDRLSRLFQAPPVRRSAWRNRILVSLGHLLIAIGRRLTNDSHPANNLQPATFNFRP
jgi:hypothetical protein